MLFGNMRSNELFISCNLKKGNYYMNEKFLSEMRNENSVSPKVC